jgi:hypothetical protein
MTETESEREELKMRMKAVVGGTGMAGKGGTDSAI